MNKKLLYFLVPGLIILTAASIIIPIVVVNKQQTLTYTTPSITILNDAISIKCKLEGGIEANLTSGEPVEIPNLDIGIFTENGVDWAIFVCCLFNYEDFDYYSATISVDKIGSLNNHSALIILDAFYPNNSTMDDDDLVSIGMLDDFAFGSDPEEYHWEYTWSGAYGLRIVVLTKYGPFE